MSDRKEAALVCRRWYEAASDPILLRDTLVTMHAPVLTSDIFRQLGRRKTPNLVIDHIDGSFSSKYLMMSSSENLTGNLQSMTLKGSNITENMFTGVLILDLYALFMHTYSCIIDIFFV